MHLDKRFAFHSFIIDEILSVSRDSAYLRDYKFQGALAYVEILHGYLGIFFANHLSGECYRCCIDYKLDQLLLLPDV